MWIELIASIRVGDTLLFRLSGMLRNHDVDYCFIVDSLEDYGFESGRRMFSIYVMSKYGAA